MLDDSQSKRRLAGARAAGNANDARVGPWRGVVVALHSLEGIGGGHFQSLTSNRDTTMAKQSKRDSLASSEVKGDGCEEKESAKFLVEDAVQRRVRAQPSARTALFFTNHEAFFSHLHHILHLSAFRTSVC